jgi:hypothetical protein
LARGHLACRLRFADGLEQFADAWPLRQAELGHQIIAGNQWRRRNISC